MGNLSFLKMHRWSLRVAVLLCCALVVHCDTTSVTLCNLLPNSTAVFAPALPLDSAAAPSTCGTRLPFAQCCEVSGVLFPFRALGGATLDRGFDRPPSGSWAKSFPLTATYWGKELPFPRRVTLRLWV